MDIEKLTNALSCVVGIYDSTYISVPVTTGSYFIEWYKQSGNKLQGQFYKDALREYVITKNIDDAKFLIESVKNNYSGIVIEPTSLEMPDWSQEEFHAFWGTVIEKYARRTIFKNGWNFSKGCCYEFLVTVKKNIPAINETGKEISLSQAINLIEIAVNKYSELSIETDFFKSIHTELLNLNTKIDNAL